MTGTDSILRIFPPNQRNRWIQTANLYDRLEEIRLREGKPALVKLHDDEYFIKPEGGLDKQKAAAYCIASKDLQDILNQVCHASLYAYEDEIRQGFLTVPGGHRIGIAGQAVLEESGKIRTMKHISAMNIRISHEILGVADGVLPCLYNKEHLYNTLIVSPPGCGKTTLLRDIIRQISNGNHYGRGMTVGVVDERSEIAGSYLGIAQNDLGIRTDVLDACPKVHGMMMLIRSMSPQVVAIDEVGSMEDVQALQRVSACGCRLLATIHGYGVEEVQKKAYMKELLEEGLFDRYIVMKKENGCPCVEGVYTKEKVLCSGL